MNVHDTASVIAYFGAAWPNFDPSDDTLDVWVNEVEDIDPTDATEAMRELVRTSKFAPSIAEFRVACQAIALRRRQLVRVAALPSAPMEVPTDLTAALRAMGKEAAGKVHWHGGPDPCRVCGGIAPPSKQKRRPLPEVEKSWCSRCGSQSMPHCATGDPSPVPAMQPYQEDA